MKLQAIRLHDFSMGHRVIGEGPDNKCAHLHGHNYRVIFYCESEQESDTDNSSGYVVNLSIVKEKLCMWVEDNYDHRMMIWDKDPILSKLQELEPDHIVSVPFKPSTENIAHHLLTVVGPLQLAGTGARLTKVEIIETMKCSSIAEI
uniref:6-carboxy-5,6,7,8-tetrahydropterin synthase n=1 Tax=Candidatus Kentrum sp. FM TaxID=2126340 RepID=A0A450TCY5_9GAMM|nr:MAG: 6-pyruvoyltetrahydropterin/6-carboxytetrahydropterin synthase [Candidatus Kentron sp. FM]VFJ74101.1 MAG: 6-pyruvoyltetrahydropterin/6-carboxytetrahydropterin synthase [Candidatus Kentron sp. FM]VFK17816.1 MAG: 6-pyruvoyltetrahydropterin/6-carboxytetrahydropterin synthase [Candidatus Kentron sp. FM]